MLTMEDVAASQSVVESSAASPATYGRDAVVAMDVELPRLPMPPPPASGWTMLMLCNSGCPALSGKFLFRIFCICAFPVHVSVIPYTDRTEVGINRYDSYRYSPLNGTASVGKMGFRKIHTDALSARFIPYRPFAQP
ncbi:hypothetical protein Tsubulata_021947 [Turnera subulata]|nr:hypothetical protein Tsubulata_021947 [Turnera subulata]